MPSTRRVLHRSSNSNNNRRSDAATSATSLSTSTLTSLPTSAPATSSSSAAAAAAAARATRLLPAHYHHSNDNNDDNNNARRRSSSSSGSQARAVTIDRDVFATPDFSSATFVNNIGSRVLFPVMQRHRQGMRRVTMAPATANNSHNNDNDNNSSTDVAARDGERNAGGGSSTNGTTQGRLPGSDAATPGDVDYVAVASTLASTLDDAEAEVTRLLRDEAAARRRREVYCRRVEIREKRRLAQVRLGLESTTARLHEYANLIGNAQAATAGIETHLAQSNARVQRGRAVHKLLRYFKAFVALQPAELAALLRALSKARATQRAAVTAQWQRGHVSRYNPRYYTTAATAPATATTTTTRAAVPGEHDAAEDDDDDVVVDVTRRGRRRTAQTTSAAAADNNKVHSDNDSDQGGSSSSSSSSDRDDSDEDGVRSGARRSETVVTRAEATAMATGLDRVFALRRYTEAQVMWAQKLQLLASELGALVQHTGNVALYVAWLRQELVADLLHLIARFNAYYDDKGDAAVQLAYGRALLRTLALVSRLYSNLTPSNDALLSVFFAHMINDMAVALFSEHTPTPLPAQPPLPLPTPLLAMEHLAQHKGEYASAFAFLLRRLKRDVVVVEVVFGTQYNNSNNNSSGGSGGGSSDGSTTANNGSSSSSSGSGGSDVGAHTTAAVAAAAAAVTAAAADTPGERASTMAMATARQQLLVRATEGVVRPFIVQQIKLAETHRAAMLHAEATLSPRGRRRCGARVADAMAYHHAVTVHLYTLFRRLVDGLRAMYGALEADVVARYGDGIFASRAAYGNARDELALLRRYHTLIDEHYTRALHPVPDELFDLREAHMAKARALLDRLGEVATRVRVYAPARAAGRYVYELLVAALQHMGDFLAEELAKVYETLRGDRERWRQRPASEDELLRPSRPEAQQCGLRMLLFALSTLMSFSDVVAVLCMPLLKAYPRLLRDYNEARATALDTLDERAERVLNLCVQAIVVRSLAILLHYQGKNDYLPKLPPPPSSSSSSSAQNKSNGSGAADDKDAAALAPSCTRACTLFCYYVTRQFDEAKEFIRLSNGQLPARLSSGATVAPVTRHRRQHNNNNNNNNSRSNSVGSATRRSNSSSVGGGGGASTSSWASQSAAAAFAATSSSMTVTASAYNNNGNNNNNNNSAEMAVLGAVADGFSLLLSHSTSPTVSARDAVRARARTMNMQQLLYGDGGPSSFVRTLGVCLYRGLAAHLKSMTANDRGALVYKQDVTAYKAAMAPLTSTPGLGGAVVEVLFTLLKETSSLLLMPLDHIHAVKQAGMLRLLSNDEKVRFLRIRQDMRAAFKIIEQ